MESLVCLHYECDVHPNTLHLASIMACRFLAKQSFLDVDITANLKLVCCLALFSSAKFEDGYSLKVTKFLQHIGSGYQEETFLRYYYSSTIQHSFMHALFYFIISSLSLFMY